MEYFDVLDKNGNPTEKTKLASEVHRDGDWHKTVHVWIVNSKGELLVQKRAPNVENYPDTWDIPSAGHISAGETSITSAMRETEEEIGLTFKKRNFELLFTVTQQMVSKKGAYINNEFNDVYLIKSDLGLNDIKLQKEEVSEIKFIPFRELEKIVLQNDPSFVPHPEEYRKLFELLSKRYS